MAEIDPPDAVRSHGFESPFHPLQIMGWAVFGTDVVAVGVFAVPILASLPFQLAAAVLYAASVAASVAACVAATSCNPADASVLAKSEQAQYDLGDDTSEVPFCEICDVPVHPRSKHCHACNKCIGIFDHHCMWLNTCIGAANYTQFFMLLVSVDAMLGVLLCSVGSLIVEFVLFADDFQSRAEEVLSMPVGLVVLAHVVLCLANLPLFLLVSQLILFHLFLAHQGLTTYEYIDAKRNLDAGREPGEGSFRALPQCMDWIVFARCWRRRRRRRREQESQEGETRPGGRVPSDPPLRSARLGSPAGLSSFTLFHAEGKADARPGAKYARSEELAPEAPSDATSETATTGDFGELAGRFYTPGAVGDDLSCAGDHFCLAPSTRSSAGSSWLQDALVPETTGVLHQSAATSWELARLAGLAEHRAFSDPCAQDLVATPLPHANATTPVGCLGRMNPSERWLRADDDLPPAAPAGPSAASGPAAEVGPHAVVPRPPLQRPASDLVLRPSMPPRPRTASSVGHGTSAHDDAADSWLVLDA